MLVDLELWVFSGGHKAARLRGRHEANFPGAKHVVLTFSHMATQDSTLTVPNCDIRRECRDSTKLWLNVILWPEQNTYFSCKKKNKTSALLYIKFSYYEKLVLCQIWNARF